MKRLLFIVFVFASLLFFTPKTYAVTVESQSDRTSDVQTFIVLASPEMNSTAVQLRLEIEGGKVTSFTAGDDGLLSIGVCDQESSKFTENSICVDIANVSGVFEYGDVLGVFTVERANNLTQLKVTKTEGNSYMGPDGEFREETGQAFLLFGATPESKKSTKDDTSVFLYLFLLIAFLTGAVFGTTFTTLGHVLQAEKTHKRHNKKD